MNRANAGKLWFIYMLISLTSCTRTLTVGLLVNDIEMPTIEQSALAQTLIVDNTLSFEYISLDLLDDLSKYDVIWYHRNDSLPITEEEVDAKESLIPYVTNGGNLILSMEAVHLLNSWGIEPEKIETIEYDAIDKGFGRKVGFHAYREHPIFDKLFGGAYTWHAKENNKCRVHGFFGDKKPIAEGSNVIGTLWEYIFFHPKDKVLWETNIGAGKLLAIGGFLYYAQDNFHRDILEQFTLNSVNYLVGDSRDTDVNSYYWEDRGSEVIEQTISTDKIELLSPEIWNTIDTTDHIKWNATNSTINLPSRRSILIAEERAGIEEIWTHPFLSMRDYNIWLDVVGHDKLLSLRSYKPEIELRPNAIIRTYHIDGFQFKEILTAEVNKPIIVAHYEWGGGTIKRIITDFKSNLRFMWPYDENALGSIYYDWSSDMNAFIIHDFNKEFISLVGSNIKGQPLLSGKFDGFTYENKKPKGIDTDKLQVASSISYSIESEESLDIYFVSGNEGVEKVISDYSNAIESPQSIFHNSASYYEDYLANHLQIITPDTTFNEGFRWATLSSLQFLVNTPGIGTSLMAGYSSSRKGWGGAHEVSGRPGYAWYFGRDAVWSAFAFCGLGDFTIVKEVLQTLIRYQQVDGKIYHELTTSGAVHFDASDATPLFVNLMARYLRATGDIDFVEKNRTSLYKAMDYCYSTDTDGDMLIEISNVGHGWLEGGKLYGSHTEFYLSGIWNAALEDAAYLASHLGDIDKHRQYTSDAKKVNKILNNDFWNEKGYYNYGKRRDGSFTQECIIIATVPVYLGVTEPERSWQMMKKFSSNRYSTDWGVRMISNTHPIFNPSAYHYGSVWPLFTGWTALADYKIGRYNQGFAHIMSNLLHYKGFSHGRVPEVIHGTTYKPSGVTLHQCWSETMVIQPTIDGMLGFAPDALNNSVNIAPRLPSHWNTIGVNNLRIGNTHLNFNMEKEVGKSIYTFNTSAPLSMTFEPSFSLGSEIKKILVNGEVWEFKRLDSREYTTISMQILLDKVSTIEIYIMQGNSALPNYTTSKPDGVSKGIRLLEQYYSNEALKIEVEASPSSSLPLEVYLPNGYSHIDGAEFVTDKGGGRYIIEVDFPDSREKYVTKILTIYKK